MSLKKELDGKVAEIFRSQWTVRPGRVVPEPKDVGMGNDAIALDPAAVLYADLSGSTRMVESKSRDFAAEVYKSFLYVAARIINAEGGSITAYDGDRIMAVFLGGSKNADAARCALKINYAVKNIVNPALKHQYPDSAFQIQHVVGVDTSSVMAARTGVRGDNDLVWVGRAPNYAAKLTELSADCPTWITGNVLDMLSDDLKYGGDPKRPMWEERSWTAMNNMRIYGSNWWWRVE